jgi:hypothetical protein
MTIDPERLAAFADGELDAETARSVEAEIATNAELQAKLAAHRALRGRLTAHFAPIVDQPVPERWVETVMNTAEPAAVLDFAAEARKRRPIVQGAQWPRIAVPALAASLVLALVGMNMLSSNDYANDDLAHALDSQLIATQKADAPVRMLLSFRDRDGAYCRGFADRARTGIACRDDHGWRLRKLFDGASGANEYRQAGSPDLAVMSAIEDIATGAALDAQGELAAARAGWRAK